MPLSISSSERRSPANEPVKAAPRSLFTPAAILLGLMGMLFLLFNLIVNRFVSPGPEFPSQAALVAGDHCVYTFGNSRFMAAIDEKQLAAMLSEPGDRVGVHQFVGNSWDALHYYMLALLSKNLLRPGRDVVVIETAAISLDDNVDRNRVDAIAPQASIPIAFLPRESLEMRLEVLFAGTSAAYRNRIAFHRGWIHDWAGNVSEVSGRILWKLGLQRPKADGGSVRMSPDVSSDPQSNEQWRLEFRRNLETETSAMRMGGTKLTAMRLAVQTLRNHQITVYLVQTPMSAWLEDQLRSNPANVSFREVMPQLAKTTGAELLLDWPAEAYDATRYIDDVHMVRGERGSGYFTGLLASELIKRNWKTAGR